VSWSRVPLRRIYRRVEIRGRADLPLLSVYRDYGVVPRAGREDNYNKPSDDLSSYKVVEPGDLVLNKMKTWQGSLGVSAHRGIVSPAYLVGRRIAQVEDGFMHHLLRSQPLIAAYGSRSKGIRPSQWDLPWEEFASIVVNIPNRFEQRAIADFLDSETARIDALITKKRRMIDLLEARARSEIDRAVGIVVDWSNAGVPRPREQGLRIARLGVVCHIQSGLTLDAAREVDPDVQPLPYLRVANVQDGSIDLSELKEVRVPGHLAARTMLREGDVLMTEGGDPDKLGRGAVWPGHIRPCLHQNHVFAVRPGANVCSDYLALLTRSSYARAYFEVTASKTTGIASTSTTKIASFRVPLPPSHTQAQVVARWQTTNAKITTAIDTLTSQNALLREHRQALITAAVTGDLSIPGAAA